ncbi:hypothetical protein BBJ28_00010839 [Nothophytophthora sp. Chile5]|nr:hypothetical protein BBJ28_00010839 [Nothophytophthora sp. Chile5]
MPPSPAFQVAFGHHNHLLAAVDEEGVICVLDPGRESRKSRWMAHRNAIFDAIWTHDDSRLLTASGDLQIRIWDAETTDQAVNTPIATLRGHEMSVKCIRQAPTETHVFASGGRDGRVLLWDTRATGKPVSSLFDVHAEPSSSMRASSGVSFLSPGQKRQRRGRGGDASAVAITQSPRSVTCVEFGGSSHELVTAGAVDAVVKFWDLRRLSSGFGSVRSTGKRKSPSASPIPTREISCSTREGAHHGISSLNFHPGGSGGVSHLLVNVLNDSIAVIDVGEHQIGSQKAQNRTVLRCSGHRATSFYSKATFSPDGDFIAGASADGVVYLWDAQVTTASFDSVSSTVAGAQRGPCLALKGHKSEVNGVAWSSQDFTQLASCSDDGTVRCWQIDGERDEPLDGQQQGRNEDPASFTLNQTSRRGNQAALANWSAFTEQPDGFAYSVRVNSSLSSTRTSPKRGRGPKRVEKQDASPQVIRRGDELRLHCVHQNAERSQGQDQMIQQTQQTAPAIDQARRSQRTLLDLWGR